MLLQSNIIFWIFVQLHEFGFVETDLSHTRRSSYFKIFPGDGSVTNQVGACSYQSSIVPWVLDNFHSNSSLWENIGFIG